MKKTILTFLLLPLFLIAVFSSIQVDQLTQLADPEKADAEQLTPSKAEKQPASVEDPIRSERTAPSARTLTIGAIGDILIHSPVYQSAQTVSGYNFRPMLEAVKPYLQQPDILTANQESLWGGKKLGLSGYPMFNSPQEIGEAVKDAGVDIVSTANNHSLDRHEAGQTAALTYMDRIGMKHAGTYLNAEDAAKTEITTIRGIRIAWLSYTYGTNGVPIPENKGYLVNLIDRDKMSRDIRRAKEEADLVVVSIHWGTEYQLLPNGEQKSIAQFAVNEGADILFGAHPHVLQPMEWLTSEDGHRALVIYSLGNFLSGQIGEKRQIGGVATVQVTKRTRNGRSSIALSEPSFLPTYVARNHDFKVVPLKDAGAYGLPGAENKYQEIMSHVLSPVRRAR